MCFWKLMFIFTAAYGVIAMILLALYSIEKYKRIKYTYPARRKRAKAQE